MRLYFIRFVWIIFILAGLYMILKDGNDTIQTLIYIAWIVVGVLNYLFSKDNSRHFTLSVILLLSLIAIGSYLYINTDILF